MSNILLKDIMPVAQLESYRMRHYFIGVEHLFIAMLKMNSTAMRLLEEQGLTPQYVVDKVRAKIGKGLSGDQNLINAEFPPTPRVVKILRLTEDIAQKNNHLEADEHDLLLAILEEGDSIPVRVLKALDLDVQLLTRVTRKKKPSPGYEFPVMIEYSPDYNDKPEISKPYLTILRKMFHGYVRIRMERLLKNGYTNASVFVVTPFQIDNIPHAAVIVKIARTADILEEARRYEVHAKNTLPPLCPRLEEKPVAPENSEFAGLKYTLVAGSDGISKDLRTIIREWEPEAVGLWLLEQLYPTFGENWWKQVRPYRFETRKEYDWILPPVLTIDYLDVATSPQDSAILSYPMRRYRLAQLGSGDTVTLEGFVIQKVDRENRTLTLGLGNIATYENPYQIKVRGIDLDKKIYFPGEIVEALSGEVWETRHGHLMMAARDLVPDFNLNDDFVPMVPDRSLSMLNPLKNYEPLLDWRINGISSKIHGDMHLGNIMVGLNNSPFLIDFAFARDGHTLLDWACLELSLLNELVMPTAGTEWVDVRRVIRYLIEVNAGRSLPETSPLSRVLAPVIQIRHIVYDIIQRCHPETLDWTQYFVALTMCALRAMTWEKTMPLASRRLMFLVAGLAINELRETPVPLPGDTPSPDATDFNTNTPL